MISVDVLISFIHSNLATFIEANNVLDKVYDWLRAYKLSLNVHLVNFKILPNKNVTTILTTKINNETINYEDKISIFRGYNRQEAEINLS